MAWLLLLLATLLGTGMAAKTTRVRRQSYPNCLVARANCAEHFPDMESYPNIGQGFRGYDLIRGTLDNQV